MHRRQGDHHATVAFVGYQTQGAGLCHAEVYPGDAQVCLQEYLAQLQAGGARHYGNIFSIGQAQLLVEQFSHIGTAQMSCRGNDMGRRLPAQLHDIFAEIGLNHAQPGVFEGAVQVDLLADHRFRLGNQVRPIGFSDVQYDLHGFGCVGCRVDDYSVSCRPVDEFIQVAIQVGDGLHARTAWARWRSTATSSGSEA